jgi:hypothetical protein
MYDIFYVSASNGNDKDWLTIKSKYPLAQKLTNIKSYEEIQSKSFTKLFWVIWDDVDLTSFNLLDYKASKWDDMYVHVFKNGEYDDGICLFPKSLTISQREFHHRFFTAKKEIDIVASNPKQYNKYCPSTFEEYQQITDDMFWILAPGVKILNEEIFNLYFSHHNSYDRRENHVFKNLCNGEEVYLNGLILCSKYKILSKKEFERQYTVDKKEHDTLVCKFQYSVYTINNYVEYLEIVNAEKQKMFWCVWHGIEVIDASIFDLYFKPNNPTLDYDRSENHVFKNLCNDKESYLSGVVLFSTTKIISEREFNRRYLIDKKEHDVIVSRYAYPKHNLTSYSEYLEILENETQPMFWGIWSEILITDSTIFNLYFDPNDGKYDHDRKENHVFKNLCNTTETFLCGLVLFSKEKIISEREFNRRYLIDKKEYPLVVSRYVYPRHNLTTYTEYLQIVKNEMQTMFWGIWPEIEVTDNTVFNLYFDPNDGKYEHDRKENHVFKNVCNDKETYLCGLVLFSKEKIISEREFNRRYLIDKKEHDVIVSRYRYNKYTLSSYDEYVEIATNELQPMFWGIWPEIEVTDNTVFNLYFDPNDGKYDHDRKENHTFKHMFNDSEIYNNGVILFSKDKIIGQREFNHRFLIEKKEHDVIASKHHMYDVVFISYNEANAEENYLRLVDACPRAKRVHGIKGIHNAHIKAAKLCNTDMIWVVDGDAVVEDNFNFDLVMSSYDIDCVHVWRSRNPINNLEYGNGGVKLLPRQLTLHMDVNTSDMTTSISKKFKAMDTVSNINSFNTDKFTTWRSAFRECCKLSSRAIERQFEEETQQRLDIWCTIGHDERFGEYAIAGAKAGRQYGLENKNNLEDLRKINDFEWLKEKFDASK